MSDGASIFSMVSGLGDSFSKAYAGARKQAQEDDAPGLIEAYLKAGQAGSPGALPSIAPVAGGGAVAGGASGTPVFAANSGAIGDYLAQTRARESGGNDLAQNPNSTAKGRFQFTDGTWTGVAKRHPDLGLTPGGWSDPDQQERAMQAFTADNARALTAAGLPINPGTLYASHFLGEAGGPKFVGGAMSNPDQPAIALATPGAVRANRSVFFEKDGRPKTAGQVFSWMGGSTPSQAAPTAPAAAPVAVASNEAETQALEQRMGMVPSETTAVASADPDAANKPAPGAVPTTGFLIPGQTDSASVVPTAPQAFPGFGTRSDRTSPEQLAALKALWKNPVTRPFAAQALASVLKGQDVSWSMVDLGHGRKALFDAKSARMLPLPGTGDQFVDATDGDGNQFKINSATGERSLVVAGKKDDKFTYQSMPGVGMVALHPTDPDKSRVIIQGQQPRPLTADERAAYNIPAGQAGGMGADGKPFGIGGSKTEVNVDTKGEGKFKEKANEIQANRYGAMVDAADQAVPLRADIDTMVSLAQDFSTGRLANVRLGLGQYAKAAGMDDLAAKIAGGTIESAEAFTAIADKLVPRMRVPGSGSTSDAEGRAFKNSLPSLLKSSQGNAIIADTFRGLADYQAQAGEIAGKALRGEISQGEADQALKGLPSPYARFKAYRGSDKPTPDAAGASDLPKGEARTKLPDGYSAARALGEAKQAVAAGKDKAAIGEWLKARGIDPKRLDD